MLCKWEACTGCMACVNICPVGAINRQLDQEGFLHPIIDNEKCIHCGKCQRICPQNGASNRASGEKLVYACWHKNSKIRKASASGGAFSNLAHWILSQGGVVFGAGFDNEMNVIHKPAYNLQELSELRGSKYVQSDTNLTFQKVKKCLEEKRLVLYSGTACQIDGLYAYLGSRKAGQLFTIDLVCHGVPSPMVYQDYLTYMEARFHSKVEQVYFRNKEPGWYVFGMKLVFANGRVYKANTYEDPYIRGFLRELFLRPSCHQCSYAGIERVADITLADFWGYVDTCWADRDYDKGISMVMLNTENGQWIFESVRRCMHVYPRPLEEAVKGNPALNKCFPPSIKREQFWKDYSEKDFKQIAEMYLYPEPKENQYWPRLKERHKQQDRYALKILPNQIAMKLLGRKRYNEFKSMIKRGRNAEN